MWRKSSYSTFSSNCLEWRTSSHSTHNGECLEARGGVQVRDSKDPGGPVLAFSGEAWTEFLGRVRAG